MRVCWSTHHIVFLISPHRRTTLNGKQQHSSLRPPWFPCTHTYARAVCRVPCAVCRSGGEQEADFAHVSRVFSRMLSAGRYVDVVATDIAAGLILVRHVQKAEVRPRVRPRVCSTTFLFGSCTMVACSLSQGPSFSFWGPIVAEDTKERKKQDREKRLPWQRTSRTGRPLTSGNDRACDFLAR